MTETAVAVREDRHPIIVQIDNRMPEIARILPTGMDPERFRKVVVQAMLRTPALWECTPISIITAITEAAEVGIEPTGVLGKGWLIPYKGEAKFIPGWRGFVDLLWRADKILLSVDLVRVGDEFSYRRGTDKYLHHTPDLSDPEREASDDNVTFAYVMAQFPDGREDFEVMSRVSLDKIRAAALAKAKDKSKAIWTLHPGEMMKKTPIRRLAKRMPLSPAVQAMLARDEDTDYDTPVERVADPKRDGIRDRIAQRTAALRGESTGEPEGSEPLAGNRAESEIARRAAGAEPAAPSVQGGPAGGSPAKGDPWMRRLHAVGNERGMNHAALHDWAVEHFGVESLSDLTIHQRATFMELVERMEVMPQPSSVPAPAGSVGEGSASPPSIETPPSGFDPSDAATAQPEDDTAPPGAYPSAASAPTDEQILAAAGPGSEIVPAELQARIDKARSKGKKPDAVQESLAQALGATTSD